jgi:hypothetical protein
MPRRPCGFNDRVMFLSSVMTRLGFDGSSISWYESTMRAASSPFGSPRIVRRAEDGTHVHEVFDLHPLTDDLQHRRLDVFGVHDAVRSDAPRDVSVNQAPPAPRSATTDPSAMPSVSMICSGFCH